MAGTPRSWSGSSGPPAIVRAALVGVAVVAGAVRCSDGDPPPRGRGSLASVTSPAAVRGIRLVFLAVAAFAAAAGWLLAHPLPFIVALLIAGVDILETSLLLLVVNLRRER